MSLRGTTASGGRGAGGGSGEKAASPWKGIKTMTSVKQPAEEIKKSIRDNEAADSERRSGLPSSSERSQRDESARRGLRRHPLLYSVTDSRCEIFQVFPL